MVAAAAFLLALVLAVPPLAPDQRAQLMTATDGSPNIDEAALYPLLHNTEQWAPGDEVGAVVPDYAQIAQSPDAARGQLFLIEGQLAAWNIEPRWFSRAGPWDGHLQRWVIVVGPKRDRAVIVYLVTPTPEMNPAGLHRLQHVRLVARFYKTWLDAAAGDNAKTFLTFIGRDARVVYPPPTDDSMRWLAPVAALLVCLSAAWFLVRFLRPGRAWLFNAPARLPPNVGEPPPPDEEEEEDAGPPLPADPVAALEEMERRRAQRAREHQGP